MSYQFLNRIQKLNTLIKMKATGSPKSLASKMGISERTLYELLKIMRQSGAPIDYSKERQTYFYRLKGQFEIGFYINNEENILKKIKTTNSAMVEASDKRYY